MKLLLQGVVTIAITVSTAVAETNRGVSWLGQMCHSKASCDVITKSFEQATTINVGWLYGTFNATGCKCSPRVLSDPRPKRVRVSICNSTCFPERGRRCQRHECFAGMNSRQATRAILNDNPATYRRIDKIVAMAKTDMAQAIQPVQFYVQACLECTLSRAAREKLNSYVANQFAPPVMFVDNPVGDKCLPGMICEKHGNVKGGRGVIVDLDGVDYSRINKQDFWQKNRQSLVALAWKPCANGISPGGFVPPLQRYRFCTQKDALEFQDAIIRRLG